MSPPYEVEFRPEATSDLDRLSPDIRERVLYTASLRLRLITIHLVGHRRDIYR